MPAQGLQVAYQVLSGKFQVELFVRVTEQKGQERYLLAVHLGNVLTGGRTTVCGGGASLQSQLIYRTEAGEANDRYVCVLAVHLGDVLAGGRADDRGGGAGSRQLAQQRRVAAAQWLVGRRQHQRRRALDAFVLARSRPCGACVGVFTAVRWI